MTQDLPEIPGFRYIRPLSRNMRLYRDLRGDREVAVKVLEDPPRTAELKAVVSLGHPGIVTVHRAGRTRFGLVYLVMNHYPSGDLSTAAPLPAARVLEIGIQVADALQAAHEVGVTHRNIKPANILLDEHGDPVLTEFGVHGRDSFPWTAPEVLRDGHHSPATDIFSLGATLRHLLTGQSPFVAPHGNNRPTALRSLDELLHQAMATNPAARPASAKKFAARLRAIQLGQGTTKTPSQATNVAAVEHGTRKRTRWPAYATVGAVAVAIVVTSVILLPRNNSLTPATQPDKAVQPRNAGGETGLPSRPAVTVTRVGPDTLRFAWTYDAPLATDTFAWRTNDDLKTGTTDTPSLELFAPGTLCIQVKVIRTDRSNPKADEWSAEGCGF
ncbi:serine/threonine-protein kinase [Lentzea sp. NPDC005914]|uniref:serine/threonine-protein kinase n=1 Tax=Lentzea sp. NPDC005914 TaxID=3154572 RepID=UPI0033CE3F6A